MLTRTLSIVNPLSVGNKRKHPSPEDNCELEFKKLKKHYNEEFGVESFRKKVQDDDGDEPEDVMQTFAHYDEFCRDIGEDRTEQCLDALSDMIDFIRKQHRLLEKQRTLILASQKCEETTQEEEEKGEGAAEEVKATEESYGGASVGLPGAESNPICLEDS